MRKVVLAVLLWVGGSLLPLRVHGANPPIYNQQKINELAAIVEEGVIALLEAPRVRQPKEALHPYLERLLAPLPNEAVALYQKRVHGYITLFCQVSDSMLIAHAFPKLRETSNINVERWKSLTTNLGYLPLKCAKLKNRWSELQKLASVTPIQVLKQRAFVQEAKMTLLILVEVRKNLGLVRP